MFALTLLLLAELPMPISLSDVDRFPRWSTVEVQQLRRESLDEHLRLMRSVHGWSDGYWDAQIAENERHRRYWHLLECAGHARAGFGDEWRRRHLVELLDLIGPPRYWQGWHPPLIPADCPTLP